MSEKQQDNFEKQNKSAKKPNKLKLNIKNIGVDIDKAEYQQIVLSNSNSPESSYFKKDFYD